MIVKKHFSKPKAIRNVDTNIQYQNRVINKLEYEPETIFEREQYELIKDINQLEWNISSPDYSGAYGEIQVLKELKNLSDDYHIICDKKCGTYN